MPKTAISAARLLRHVATVAAVAGVLVSLPQATASGAESLATSVTADVSTSQAVVGAEVTVSGVVTPAEVGASRTVVLELGTANGWRQVARGSTNTTGSYALQVPTDWYASHELRVVAPAIAIAEAGVSAVRTVDVTPSYKPRGNSSAWERYPSQARWDPCTVVEYRTNLHRAPKGSLSKVRRAFAIVHAATGLTFRHAGATSKVPFSRAPEKRQFLSDGLVVAWTTPRVVPALSGNTTGYGGATYRNIDGGAAQYVYGGVAIDATREVPANGAATLTLLLHEIAHAIGLNHAEAPSQTMYDEVLSSHRGQYEAGDLAGLHAVGAEQGCL